MCKFKPDYIFIFPTRKPCFWNEQNQFHGCIQCPYTHTHAQENRAVSICYFLKVKIKSKKRERKHPALSTQSVVWVNSQKRRGGGALVKQWIVKQAACTGQLGGINIFL